MGNSMGVRVGWELADATPSSERRYQRSPPSLWPAFLHILQPASQPASQPAPPSHPQSGSWLAMGGEEPSNVNHPVITVRPHARTPRHCTALWGGRACNIDDRLHSRQVIRVCAP